MLQTSSRSPISATAMASSGTCVPFPLDSMMSPVLPLPPQPRLCLSCSRFSLRKNS